MTLAISLRTARISDRMLGAFAIVAVWTAVAAVNGLQNLLLAEAHGHALSIGAALSRNLIYLVIWGLATPVIVASVRRFPVRRDTIFRYGALHVLFGSVFIVSLNLFGSSLESLLGETGFDVQAVTRSTVRSVVQLYHVALIVYLVIVMAGHLPWTRWLRTGFAHTRVVDDRAFANQSLARAEPPQPLNEIAVRNRSGVHLLSVDRVDWIEASGDHVIVHTGRERHRMRDSLKSLHARLDQRRFVRIHRSTVVNVSRVTDVQPYHYGDFTILLKTGRQLRLSRTRRQDLEKALGQRL